MHSLVIDTGLFYDFTGSMTSVAGSEMNVVIEIVKGTVIG